MPKQRRSNLRIEQGVRQHTHLVPQDFQVLSAGMQDFRDVFVFKQRGQHVQVLNGERIDDDHLVIGGKLDKAQPRIIRLLTQEFGIDGKHA